MHRYATSLAWCPPRVVRMHSHGLRHFSVSDLGSVLARFSAATTRLHNDTTQSDTLANDKYSSRGSSEGLTDQKWLRDMFSDPDKDREECSRWNKHLFEKGIGGDSSSPKK